MPDVLIVDAAPAVRASLRDLATRMGVPARAIRDASDVEGAAERLLEAPADLVLLDVEMPGSIELLEAILRVDATSRVVLTSATGRDDPRVHDGVARGAFDVLLKPIHGPDVRRVMTLVEEEASTIERIA